MAHQIEDSDYYAVLCNRIKIMENRFFFYLITMMISLRSFCCRLSRLVGHFFFIRDKLSVYYYALFASSLLLISVYLFVLCAVYVVWYGLYMCKVERLYVLETIYVTETCVSDVDVNWGTVETYHC